MSLAATFLLVLVVLGTSCGPPRDNSDDLVGANFMPVDAFSGKTGSASYLYNDSTVVENDPCEMQNSKLQSSLKIAVNHTNQENTVVLESMPPEFRNITSRNTLHEFDYSSRANIDRNTKAGGIIEFNDKRTSTTSLCPRKEKPKDYTRLVEVQSKAIVFIERFKCDNIPHQLKLSCRFD